MLKFKGDDFEIETERARFAENHRATVDPCFAFLRKRVPHLLDIHYDRLTVPKEEVDIVNIERREQLRQKAEEQYREKVLEESTATMEAEKKARLMGRLPRGGRNPGRRRQGR